MGESAAVNSKTSKSHQDVDLDDDIIPSSPPGHSTPLLPLPHLTNDPQQHPDACPSLSVPFMAALRALLPPAPATTISIGSGTGLLEALLQQLPQQQQQQQHAPVAALDLVSVEVRPSPNKYHAHHFTVPGTWALDPLAGVATAWMFVYPKQVGLVRKYLGAVPLLWGYETDVDGGGGDGDGETCGGSGYRDRRPRTVIYVGPRMDWEDCFGRAFVEELEGWGVEVWGPERMEEVGGRAWECVAVLRKREGGC